MSQTFHGILGRISQHVSLAPYESGNGFVYTSHKTGGSNGPKKMPCRANLFTPWRDT